MTDNLVWQANPFVHAIRHGAAGKIHCGTGLSFYAIPIATRTP